MKPFRWVIPLLLLVGPSALLYLLWMPDLTRLKRENPKKTAFMEYREKESRRKGRKYRIRHHWVPFSKISPYLVKAVLIAEDDKFWRHEGFDFEAIQKAIEMDLKAKRYKFGGSTISQQLARNLYLSPEKSFPRKISEAIVTWRMEKVLPKKRILELYLNLVEWGEGIFGAEAASRSYFKKAVSELSPEEAARLAAVLPNPRKYDPAGSQRYIINRSNLIYRIMVQRGIILPDYDDVTAEAASPEPEHTRALNPARGN
jgi:monofunctional biosynthetic peptidoglycan transglycosylase